MDPKENEKTAIVAFRGDLGLDEVPVVESRLPDPSGPTRVVVNLSSVSSIDSSIIATFMTFRSQFMRAGRNPLDIVVIASRQVYRVLEMTGTTRAVTVLQSPPSQNATEKAAAHDAVKPRYDEAREVRSRRGGAEP